MKKGMLLLVVIAVLGASPVLASDEREQVPDAWQSLDVVVTAVWHQMVSWLPMASSGDENGEADREPETRLERLGPMVQPNG